MTLNQSDTAIIVTLCQELASELDLHYEDHELFATKPTIMVLQEAAKLLEAKGVAVPDAHQHIYRRYVAATSGGQQ